MTKEDKPGITDPKEATNYMLTSSRSEMASILRHKKAVFVGRDGMERKFTILSVTDNFTVPDTVETVQGKRLSNLVSGEIGIVFHRNGNRPLFFVKGDEGVVEIRKASHLDGNNESDQIAAGSRDSIHRSISNLPIFLELDTLPRGQIVMCAFETSAEILVMRVIDTPEHSVPSSS